MKYFYNYLKNLGDKEIHVYIDMDGVVADYDVTSYEKHKHEKDVYLTKRPIKTSIEILREVAKLENVKLYILSVSRYNIQVDGKIKWLKDNMEYIKEENINIIPKEKNEFKSAALLKKEFLKDKVDQSAINIMIDDSHQVLDVIYELNMDIIPLHITSILD